MCVISTVRCSITQLSGYTRYPSNPSQFTSRVVFFQLTSMPGQGVVVQARILVSRQGCGTLEPVSLARLLGTLEACGRLGAGSSEGLRPFPPDPRASMRSAPCVPVRLVFPFKENLQIHQKGGNEELLPLHYAAIPM